MSPIITELAVEPVITPVPTLTYIWPTGEWPSADGVSFATTQSLATITGASARRLPGGLVRVDLTGRLRKIDGTASSLNRTLQVYAGRPQPPWLAELIKDAGRRLA